MVEWIWLDGFHRTWTLGCPVSQSWAGNPRTEAQDRWRAGELNGWISKDKRGTREALIKRRPGKAPSNDEPPSRLPLIFIGNGTGTVSTVVTIFLVLLSSCLPTLLLFPTATNCIFRSPSWPSS